MIVADPFPVVEPARAAAAFEVKQGLSAFRRVSYEDGWKGVGIQPLYDSVDRAIDRLQGGAYDALIGALESNLFPSIGEYQRAVNTGDIGTRSIAQSAMTSAFQGAILMLDPSQQE